MTLVLRRLSHVTYLVRLYGRRISERRALAALTERELRDIGVSRYDAACEMRKPFWRQ